MFFFVVSFCFGCFYAFVKESFFLLLLVLFKFVLLLLYYTTFIQTFFCFCSIRCCFPLFLVITFILIIFNIYPKHTVSFLLCSQYTPAPHPLQKQHHLIKISVSSLVPLLMQVFSVKLCCWVIWLVTVGWLAGCSFLLTLPCSHCTLVYILPFSYLKIPLYFYVCVCVCVNIFDCSLFFCSFLAFRFVCCCFAS